MEASKYDSIKTELIALQELGGTNHQENLGSDFVKRRKLPGVQCRLNEVLAANEIRADAFVRSISTAIVDFSQRPNVSGFFEKVTPNPTESLSEIFSRANIPNILSGILETATQEWPLSYVSLVLSEHLAPALFAHVFTFHFSGASSAVSERVLGLLCETRAHVVRPWLREAVGTVISDALSPAPSIGPTATALLSMLSRLSSIHPSAFTLIAPSFISALNEIESGSALLRCIQKLSAGGVIAKSTQWTSKDVCSVTLDMLQDLAPHAPTIVAFLMRVESSELKEVAAGKLATSLLDSILHQIQCATLSKPLVQHPHPDPLTSALSFAHSLRSSISHFCKLLSTSNGFSDVDISTEKSAQRAHEFLRTICCLEDRSSSSSVEQCVDVLISLFEHKNESFVSSLFTSFSINMPTFPTALIEKVVESVRKQDPSVPLMLAGLDSLLSSPQLCGAPQRTLSSSVLNSWRSFLGLLTSTHHSATATRILSSCLHVMGTSCGSQEFLRQMFESSLVMYFLTLPSLATNGFVLESTLRGPIEELFCELSRLVAPEPLADFFLDSISSPLTDRVLRTPPYAPLRLANKLLEPLSKHSSLSSLLSAHLGIENTQLLLHESHIDVMDSSPKTFSMLEQVRQRYGKSITVENQKNTSHAASSMRTKINVAEAATVKSNQKLVVSLLSRLLLSQSDPTPLRAALVSQLSVRLTPLASPPTRKQYDDMLPRRPMFERDVFVHRAFSRNPILFQVLEIASQDLLPSSPLSDVLSSLLASYVGIWNAELSSSCAALEPTRHILAALSKAGLLPHPLCHASEILHLITPQETTKILLGLWRFAVSPQTEREANREECLKQIQDIMLANVKTVSAMFPRFFEVHNE